MQEWFVSLKQKSKVGDLTPSKLSECSFPMHCLYIDTFLIAQVGQTNKIVKCVYSTSVCGTREIGWKFWEGCYSQINIYDCVPSPHSVIIIVTRFCVHIYIKKTAIFIWLLALTVKGSPSLDKAIITWSNKKDSTNCLLDKNCALFMTEISTSPCYIQRKWNWEFKVLYKKNPRYDSNKA